MKRNRFLAVMLGLTAAPAVFGVKNNIADLTMGKGFKINENSTCLDAG